MNDSEPCVLYVMTWASFLSFWQKIEEIPSKWPSVYTIIFNSSTLIDIINYMYIKVALKNCYPNTIQHPSLWRVTIFNYLPWKSIRVVQKKNFRKHLIANIISLFKYDFHYNIVWRWGVQNITLKTLEFYKGYILLFTSLYVLFINIFFIFLHLSLTCFIKILLHVKYLLFQNILEL